MNTSYYLTSIFVSTLIKSATEQPEQARMEENMYEVEAILGKKVDKNNGMVHYLIRWKGYPDDQASWEPAWTLSSIASLIELYQNRTASEKTKKTKPAVKSVQKVEWEPLEKATKAKAINIKKRQKQFLLPKTEVTANKQEEDPPSIVHKSTIQKPALREKETSKEKHKPDLFTIKLEEKLKKSGVLANPQPESQQTFQNMQTNQPDTVEVLKIIFKGPQHKRMFEIRVGNSIIQMQAIKTKKTYPLQLCTFYERFLKFDP